MQNKNAFVGMISATVLCGAILFLGLVNINPETSQWIGFALITLALAAFAWSVIGTLLLIGRSFRAREAVAVSLRQASLLSIIVVLALYLQRFKLLTWWNVIILVVIAVLIEIIFIGKEKEGGA